MRRNFDTSAAPFLAEGSSDADFFWILMLIFSLYLLCFGYFSKLIDACEAGLWRVILFFTPKSSEDYSAWTAPILPGSFPCSALSPARPVNPTISINNGGTTTHYGGANSSSVNAAPPRSFFSAARPRDDRLYWRANDGRTYHYADRHNGKAKEIYPPPTSFNIIPETWAWQKPPPERTLEPWAHRATAQEVQEALTFADELAARKAAFRKDIERRTAITMAQIREAEERRERTLAEREMQPPKYPQTSLEEFSAALRRDDGVSLFSPVGQQSAAFVPSVASMSVSGAVTYQPATMAQPLYNGNNIPAATNHFQHLVFGRENAAPAVPVPAPVPAAPAGVIPAQQNQQTPISAPTTSASVPAAPAPSNPPADGASTATFGTVSSGGTKRPSPAEPAAPTVPAAPAPSAATAGGAWTASLGTIGSGSTSSNVRTQQKSSVPPPAAPAAPAAPAPSAATIGGAWTASLGTIGSGSTNSNIRTQPKPKPNPLPLLDGPAARSTIKKWTEALFASVQKHETIQKSAGQAQSWRTLLKHPEGRRFLVNVKQQMDWICEWAVMDAGIGAGVAVDREKVGAHQLVWLGLKGDRFDDMAAELWKGEEITKGDRLVVEAREAVNQVIFVLY